MRERRPGVWELIVQLPHDESAITARQLSRTVRGTKREAQPTQFVFVMADIDHFKRVNDTHGHETGDRALKTICEVAMSYLRQTDLMARWGDEEFAFASATHGSIAWTEEWRF